MILESLTEIVLELLAQRGGEQAEAGIELKLLKRIPSQAGLGGGSSNAVAAAYGVAKLFGMDCDDPELLEALGVLGADVPFFLSARHTGWALCTGRGERVQPLAAPISDGRVFAGLTRYAGHVALRPAIVNWRTRAADIDLLIEVLLELAADLTRLPDAETDGAR